MPTPIFDEIRLTIEQAARGKPLEPEHRFHMDGQYRSLGLKTPDFWKSMKRFKPLIMSLSLPERMDLAAALLAEHVGELGHAGIHVIALSVGFFGAQTRTLPGSAGG